MCRNWRREGDSNPRNPIGLAYLEMVPITRIIEAGAAERKACADAVRALRIGPAFDGAEHPSTRILNKAIAAIEGRGE